MDLIQNDQELIALIDRLRQEGRIALDTESDNFYRYPERVSLIQIAIGDSVYILDPLTIRDMTPLGHLLADPSIEKIFHSGDNDLRSLDRQWHFRGRTLYDTSVAASFLGLRRLGLDKVLWEVLGVAIQKDKHLQRADWGHRPLSSAALAYAMGDVAYLLQLRTALADRLETLGRTSWVVEECLRLEKVRYMPPKPPQESFFTIKGSRKLDGRGLAILREVVIFREAEAWRRGIPPFRILPNSALLALAADPESNSADMPGMGRSANLRLGQGIKEAVKVGLASPPVVRPPSPVALEPKWTNAQLSRLQSLKGWRTGEGEKLRLDPSLLWPMVSLERLARDPRGIEEEMEAPEVRLWQRDELADSLRKCLATL